ncbi:hypothetical protein, partial [Mesorhizobium sp. M7A.F.Ca.US.001.04.2.1]|uniref:ATP dependent DNA ligase n=1 Tax=Mesorhizobium sp. M7A.F.Ca.US.001.04.2.1 TaxID=2496727 RepID=UPI0032AF1BCC
MHQTTGIRRCGYRPNDTGRSMASLILGTYEKGKLVYRGRVGTGFTQASCRRRSCWPAIYR